MSLVSKLALVKEMLDSAEVNLRSAKQMIADITGISGQQQYSQIAVNLQKTQSDEGEQIIEGVFDGQIMTGPDKKTYPVPANYASKSKLVPGDILKLTIKTDGGFIYKQIGPAERKRIIGLLTYENGTYRVSAEGKAYKVLLASVTYFKGEIGDKVTLIVPALEQSEWGAIENILPKEELEGEEDEEQGEEEI